MHTRCGTSARYSAAAIVVTSLLMNIQHVLRIAYRVWSDCLQYNYASTFCCEAEEVGPKLIL